jgi:hypothetical protein
MRLIGLSGYARSGKDTVAGFLAEQGFRRAAFADILRDVLLAVDPFVGENGRLSDAIDLYGWDFAKSKMPEVRRLLQRLGTEGGRRHLGEDVWTDATFARMDPTLPWAITDVRFPSEAEAVKRHGGVVWRVERADVQPVNGHSSETALDDWPFDVTIRNDGTLDDLRFVALEAANR